MSTGSRRKLWTTSLLLLGAFGVTRLLFWLLPDVLGVWNAQAVDRLFALRSSWQATRPATDATIAHVDLNNSTIRQLKDHYLNRSHFARVVDNLHQMKVSAQVWDFILPSRLDEERDRQLVQAVRKAGNTYFGMALRLVRGAEKGEPGEPPAPRLRQFLWHPQVQGDPEEFYAGRDPLMSFEALTSAAGAPGSLSVTFDRDGVLRRVPLLIRHGDGFCPFLSFRVICDYLGVLPEEIVVTPGQHIRLKNANRPGNGSSRDILIPIDDHGNMIVNYVGAWGRMDHYNFADVFLASRDRFELEMWQEELKGRVVVVSDVSTGSTDVGPVPTDPNFPLSGLHSNVMHTILTESFISTLSGFNMAFVEALMMLGVLVMSLRFSSLAFSAGTGLLAASFLAAGGGAFLFGGVIVNLVRPLFMVVLGMTAVLIYRYVVEEREKMAGLRQRDFIRETFGRYLSNEVVEELLGSPQGLSMSGESREVTFLVSDLRGFTSLSASLSPHDVIQILNRYFERMIEVAARYRGTVNEFRGDGMLVFFGAPLQYGDEPERAVACAVCMQNELLAINEENDRSGLPHLGMGIGVHTGEVVVGNIGCEKRASYGAVGSPINTAFRIESYTVDGQILVSPETYERVRGTVRTRDKLAVQFKGLEGRVMLYDVDGISGTYAIELTEREGDRMVDLGAPLPIRCYRVEGKTVSETGIEGEMLSLSETGAVASLREEVEAHVNLKIAFKTGPHPKISDVYAKVLTVDGLQQGSDAVTVHMIFTALPPEGKVFLQEQISRRGGAV